MLKIILEILCIKIILEILCIKINFEDNFEKIGFFLLGLISLRGTFQPFRPADLESSARPGACASIFGNYFLIASFGAK